MQLMQINGDRNVRLIPDIIVGRNNGTSNGLVDGLLSMILWKQTGHNPTKTGAIPRLPPSKYKEKNRTVVKSSVSYLKNRPLAELILC